MKKKLLVIGLILLTFLCVLTANISEPTEVNVEATPTIVEAEATIVPVKPIVALPSPIEEQYTQQDLEYVEEIGEILVAFGESITVFADLFGAAGKDTNVIFEDWWIEAVAWEFTMQTILCDEIRDLEPTSLTQQFHNHLISMCDDHEMAIDWYVIGIDDIDADALNKGVEYLNKATDHLNDATEELAPILALMGD